jgi:hypothetical protein
MLRRGVLTFDYLSRRTCFQTLKPKVSTLNPPKKAGSGSSIQTKTP